MRSDLFRGELSENLSHYPFALPHKWPCQVLLSNPGQSVPTAIQTYAVFLTPPGRLPRHSESMGSSMLLVVPAQKVRSHRHLPAQDPRSTLISSTFHKGG